ncbi:MAG: ATP-binding cassette domain-containing protein [Thermodesulfobacteriota bacterium]
MALIGMRNLCWGFSTPPLLENITFQIERGERLCLLGRNGEGKSTLLKLLNGEILPDQGEIWRQQGITVAALPQNVPQGFDGTIFDVVAEGLGRQGRSLVEDNRIGKTTEVRGISKLPQNRDTGAAGPGLEDWWAISRRIETVLSRTQLPPEAKFADLSAGMKRRTLFARALAMEPDVLLLDEPTNHLDIGTILWMEDFILRYVKTLLFVTHDRAFLKKLATRVLELDRGSLFSYGCDYGIYLKRRQAVLESEEVQNGLFDKKLSQEEAWIRQGIRARRTRNEGRVTALIEMREAFRARRKKIGEVKLRIQEAERTGKLVIEARKVSFSYDGTPIVRNFSTTIMRGDKVGIIGPNGVGKTTLLNILLKNISSQAGNVRHGTHLQAGYFDQLRNQLDEQKSVIENIGDGNDFIIQNGQKRHRIGYLQDFLFSPEKCHTPVQVLSGGEKNRLMLAKLFTQPANVLVLDEPTNDLDAETLELLEELLFEYQGTLLVVSHDRTFLNNVVTSTMVFEENGQVIEYAGGYDDWLVQRPNPGKTVSAGKKEGQKNSPKPKIRKDQKLGYREKREFEELPRKINTLYSEQQELYAVMAEPLLYKKGKEEIARIRTQLADLDQAIETAYLRWEELDEKT